MAYITWTHIEVVHDACMRGLEDWRSVCKETGISRAEFLEARHHLRKADDDIGLALKHWKERSGTESDLSVLLNQISERLTRIERAHQPFSNGRNEGLSS